MEFLKIGKRYLIKNSNGRIVDEKTKLELENKELVLKDITGCECQKETTKKISKNKKRIKELEQDHTVDALRYVVDGEVKFSKERLTEPKVEIKALQDEVLDGTIEETVSTD